MKNNIQKMVINGIINAISNMSLADIMMLDSMIDAIVIKAIMPKPAPVPTTDNTPIERYIKLAKDILAVDDECDEEVCENTCCHNYDERKEELDEREDELDGREHDLNVREVELDDREIELDMREEELNEREAELDKREAELDASDSYDADEMSHTDNVADVRDTIVNLIGGIVNAINKR